MLIINSATLENITYLPAGSHEAARQTAMIYLFLGTSRIYMI